jgi:hypothetical protein
MIEQLHESSNSIKSRGGQNPEVGIILGTGLEMHLSKKFKIN